jgi:hypothetical protein
MRLIKGLLAAAITAALLVIPAGALAKSRDRDHDRMPDKWEKAHHLNVRANDARKDPDKDGLTNLSEFRHHTDPRSADSDDDGVNDENELDDHTNPLKDDSDDDGIDDADELSGAIVSFANSVLTIQLPGQGAGTVSGTVNQSTVIECDDDSAPAATTSRDGSDDNSGPGSGGEDNSGPGSTSDGSDDGANDDAGDDQGDDNDENEDSCTTADLKAGARVHEAKVAKATDGSTVFTKIELIPAA